MIKKSTYLSQEWADAFNRYESISGYEPMFIDDVKKGTKSAKYAFQKNIERLESVLSEVVNIKTPNENNKR